MQRDAGGLTPACMRVQRDAGGLTPACMRVQRDAGGLTPACLRVQRDAGGLTPACLEALHLSVLECMMTCLCNCTFPHAHSLYKYNYTLVGNDGPAVYTLAQHNWNIMLDTS